MQTITFAFPHVFHAGSDPVENSFVLRTLLNTLVAINVDYRRNHSVPTLYRSGVVYGRTRWWEVIPALYLRTYGDCKSLSAALISEYICAGQEAEPGFRFVSNEDGTTDYHILVETANGWKDPSKRLGMGANEVAKFANVRTYR